MAKKSGKRPQAIQERASRTAAVMAAPGGVGAAAKPKVGFVQAIAGAPKFFREVRAEARKITWTSRRETWITSVMVAIMVVVAVVFFAVVDGTVSFVLNQILKLAAGT